MADMIHQDWIDELVDQIEAQTEQGVKKVPIEFHLEDADEIHELVITRVQFNDGIIECKMEVF
jgi:hypothetical protein